MVLVITPALGGLRPSWREASENLGASVEYWRTVGVPVLLPSVLGGMLLLFGSAFAAYATADTLTAGTVTLTPIQIGDVLNGNVISGEQNIGYADRLRDADRALDHDGPLRPRPQEGVEMASLTPEIASRRCRGWSRRSRETHSAGATAVACLARLVLFFAGAYFLIPLYAGLRFSFENDAGQFSVYPVKAIPCQTGFSAAFFLSLRLAAVTTVLTMVLMVPTAVYVHLSCRRCDGSWTSSRSCRSSSRRSCSSSASRRGTALAEGLALPAEPHLCRPRHALRLPLARRRALGDRPQDPCGGLAVARRKWVGTLWHVILPNFRAAMLSATVLTIALVLGEFTMASLDLWTTLPVWIYQFSQLDAHIATAVSMLSLLGTWLLLTVIVSLDRSQSRRTRRRTGGL